MKTQIKICTGEKKGRRGIGEGYYSNIKASMLHLLFLFPFVQATTTTLAHINSFSL